MSSIRRQSKLPGNTVEPNRVICQLLELEGNAAESFLETQLFTNVKGNTLFLVI